MEEKESYHKSLSSTPIVDEKLTNKCLSTTEVSEQESLLPDDSAEGTIENIVVPQMKINSGKAFEN